MKTAIALALALIAPVRAASLTVVRTSPTVLAVTDAGVSEPGELRRLRDEVRKLREKLGPGTLIEVVKPRDPAVLATLLEASNGDGIVKRRVGAWRSLGASLTEIWRDAEHDARRQRVHTKIQAIGREGLAKYPPTGSRALDAMDTVTTAAGAAGVARTVAIAVHRSGAVSYAVSGEDDDAVAQLTSLLPAHWKRAAEAADTSELKPIDMGDGDVHAGPVACAEPRLFAAVARDPDPVDESVLVWTGGEVTPYELAPGRKRVVPCPACSHYADRIRKRALAAGR